MKKTLALLLVVIMTVFAFASCGSKSDSKPAGESKNDTIIGTWETDIDFGKALAGTEGADMFDLSAAKVTVTMTFTEDELSIKCDEKDIEALIESLCDQMPALLKKQIEEQTNMSFADALAAAGMTEAQFEESIKASIDEYRQQMKSLLSAQELNQTSDYELKDGSIYIDGKEDMVYELSGDKLTLNKPEGVEVEGEELLAELLPFVMKRVK